MIWIGFILGFTVAIFLSSVIYFFKKNKKIIPPSLDDKYIRRGIFEKNFSAEIGVKDKETFTVQFEVGELESTDKLSKIDVISFVADKSSFNTDVERKKVLVMTDKTWVPSVDIQWINTLASDRNKKIDQLLKK